MSVNSLAYFGLGLKLKNPSWNILMLFYELYQNIDSLGILINKIQTISLNNKNCYILATYKIINL